MQAIEITIADNYIPKMHNTTRTAHIAIWDDNEKQLITFYPEDDMQHADHLFDPKDPKSVKEAAEVLADFFEESVQDSMQFLNLFKQLPSKKKQSMESRPEDQCPVCDEPGMKEVKFHDGRNEVTNVYCRICGYEDLDRKSGD